MRTARFQKYYNMDKTYFLGLRVIKILSQSSLQFFHIEWSKYHIK